VKWNPAELMGKITTPRPRCATLKSTVSPRSVLGADMNLLGKDVSLGCVHMTARGRSVVSPEHNMAIQKVLPTAHHFIQYTNHFPCRLLNSLSIPTSYHTQYSTLKLVRMKPQHRLAKPILPRFAGYLRLVIRGDDFL